LVILYCGDPENYQETALKQECDFGMPGKLGQLGSNAAGYVAQPWRLGTQVQSMTGTKKHSHMQINDVTGYYAKNRTVSKGRREAYHHNSLKQKYGYFHSDNKRS